MMQIRIMRSAGVMVRIHVSMPTALSRLGAGGRVEFDGDLGFCVGEGEE